MSMQVLKSELRAQGKKGAARRTRAKGLVPAVCYGRGIETIALALNPNELVRLLSGDYGPNLVFNLEIKGDDSTVTRTVLVKTVQRDPVTRNIIHVDLYTIEDDRKVVVEVPIKLVGRAVGVAMGGRLRQVARSVAVKCLPKDIPTAVEFNVSAMDIKERAKVGEIVAPENLELVFPHDYAIAQILAPARSAGG